ncbi:MAG TPA: four helix bundle protein [Kiritimatiellia bacterium]|nr:four helix bundle protein [Kiritimatiellia bacterium]HNR93442.1 four helix bundle protein [Kiritimatiellia bacterium]
MREIYEMDVYRLAEELSDLVWNDFDLWPEKARRTIGYQVIRFADSIAANIAEGYGRYSSAEKIQFYRYARGSFEETKAWLRKAIRRSVIEKKRTDEFKTIIGELGPKLNAFIRSTNKGANK